MKRKSADHYRDIVRTLDIEHRIYTSVLEDVFAYLSHPNEGRVIMVSGPARVGKSQVRKAVIPRLIKTPNADSRYEPIVTVEATATIDGHMSMKHFTLRALIEERHPFVKALAHLDPDKGYVPRIKAGESELRLMLESAIETRKTFLVNVEEAHQLTRTRSKERAGEALDTLKNLGNTTGAIIGLWGGVELLEVGLASGHLNGRMRIFKFPAYYPDVKADVIEFCRVLELLDSVLPHRGGFSLLKHSESMQRGSVGCVGLLCEWTDAALAVMDACKADGLSKAHFEESRVEQQIVEIEEEVKRGRELFKKVKLLDQDKHSAPRFASRRRPKRTKPFARKPGRDPVGRRRAHTVARAVRKKARR